MHDIYNYGTPFLDLHILYAQSHKSTLDYKIDTNIDLLKFSTHDKTATFLNNMFIQGYVPTITMPTRVTHQSATLIDNIFTNKPTHEDLTGIIITDISDHFAMFHIVFYELSFLIF